jgi:hypothetical protein
MEKDSSDLWTKGNVDGGRDTGLSGKVTYAQGDASGHIFMNEIKFAGYTVANQAYSGLCHHSCLIHTKNVH